MIVLRVYELDNLSSAIPITIEDNKCYCDHNLNGADTVTFEIQRKNENHTSIAEEVKIEVFGNRFVIKKIDEHSDFTTVNCELDLDDWKAKLNKNFRMTNSTIDEVLLAIIPTGWTRNYESGVDLSKHTTVEKQEGKAFVAVTSHELLDYVADAFSVVFKFDSINKSITVVNPDSYTSSGEFFMEDLNMTELGYNGDSSEFVTRVYAYGKDGLTFASINNNKEYVENVAYSNKVVNYVITDERYTVKQNLLQYAQKVLNEKCLPKKSYTCSIKNFNGDIWLYKVVTIVDQRRKIRVEHQCVKYREYNDHSLDSITLSSQAPSIEKIVKSNSKTTNDLIEAQRTTIYDLIQQEVDAVTALITGNQGGYFKWIYDDDGKPIELVNLGDSKDINTAQQVWRWNQNGLGHSNNGYNGTYGLALTKDGKINATMITTGVLNAGVIRAGVLADVNNITTFNLEDGTLEIKKGSINLGSGNFVVTSGGVLTAKEATINGQITAGDTTGGYWTRLNLNGQLIGYRNVSGTNTQYGLVDFTAVEVDFDDHIDRYGLKLVGKDVIRIQAPKISIATDYGTGTFGWTGDVKMPKAINSDGTVATWTNARFINGFYVN